MPGDEGLPGDAARLIGGRVLPMRLCPDPDLRRPCEPAGYLKAPELLALARDLVATLAAAGAEGIAAPQIGVARRLIVVRDEGGRPVVLADPDLLEAGGPIAAADERCLSWPGGLARPARSEAVTVSWYDLDGLHLRRAWRGAPARVLQRQVDILSGRFIGGF